MRRDRAAIVGRASINAVDEIAARYPDDRRSDLYVWMTVNLREFSERVASRERTWKAWAHAFDELGIRPNDTKTVTGHAVRRTWYSVRKNTGEPIGEPAIRAELAKAKARRKPRTEAAKLIVPAPRNGEVAFGVKAVEQPKPPSEAEIETNEILADLRREMDERSGLLKKGTR